MKRTDQPAIRDTILLFGCMVLFAGIGIAIWPSWWSAPFWLAYGVLYGSAMDSRWHECSHGTPFRTAKYNDWMYQIASFCMVRNPVSWRWSHARHHTDTIIVCRDPEIVAMRPPALFRIFLNLFGLIDAVQGWKRMLLNASGKLYPGKRTCQGHYGRADMGGDLCGGHQSGSGDAVDPARDGNRIAAALWGLASCNDGCFATCGLGGKCDRSPAQ